MTKDDIPIVIYKLFEIEVVRTGQNAKYTPERPDHNLAKRGRVRHLHVLVAGDWLSKVHSELTFNDGDATRNLGSRATFGSVDTAISAAKDAIDSYIAARAKAYRQDPVAAAQWDASRLSWVDGTLIRANAEFVRLKERLANCEQQLSVAAGPRDFHASLRNKYSAQVEMARLYVDANERHLRNLAVSF